MFWSSLFAVPLFVTPTLGMLRFGCSQLTIERMDPLVFPGIVSPHVHQIIGGNAFNITMDPGTDYAKTGSCTTCRFKEDLSNYWTAILYFRHANGTYTQVPQKANHVVGNLNGGMTVYYIQPADGSSFSNFQPGFRMIAGNPLMRSKNLPYNNPVMRSSTFRCWESSGIFDPSNQASPGVGNYDTETLPNRPCAAGIRSNLFFPACWDGVNLDSPDHASHVAYYTNDVNPNVGLFLMNGGRCPSTHPVQIPQLFYEIAWDTSQFNNMWPSDGSQPFVFSMGDPTGYGQHGDYVFGWEGDSLTRAMRSCTDISGIPEGCRELTVISDNEMNSCRQNSRVNENIRGGAKLPGCNPLQGGPGEATLPVNCDAVSTTIDGANPTLVPVPVGNNPNPNPNPTPSPSPVPTPGPGPLIPHWGQCGGNGWTGGTTCESPYTCQKLNDWYSQCL